MAMKNWNNKVYWVCAQCGNLTYIVTAALDKKIPTRWGVKNVHLPYW